jgi:hypothetical protein
MGTSGVIEGGDIINDDVLPATEPRCDTYIHVFCDLLRESQYSLTTFRCLWLSPHSLAS